jgi:cobalamin biosynthesis Mg chelatase CobN
MSVIALLALACFPVLAHAECVSSSCVQYTEAIPKAEGEHSQPRHQGTPATKSNTPHGGTDAPEQSPGSEGVGSSPEEESSKEGGVGPKGSDGGTKQGNQGGSPKSGAKPSPQDSGQAISSEPPSKSSDDSPLVPILIAIAVLAAISVAVVMFRQRRQGGSGQTGSPSPEAN